MSEIWGISSPYKSEAQKPPFFDDRNLTANLTAYIFSMKHDVENWVSVQATRRDLLHRLKTA